MGKYLLAKPFVFSINEGNIKLKVRIDRIAEKGTK